MEITQKKIGDLVLRFLEINPAGQKTLIVLHGWGGGVDSWKNFLENLKKEDLRVIAFDLPGFGLSPAPLMPWGISDYAELVKKVLESYGLKKVFLLGHSFGGQIACQFAHDYPYHLEKLFLASAAAIRPNLTPGKKLLKIIAVSTKIFWPRPVRRFLYRLLGNLDYGNLTDPVMKQTMQNAIKSDLTSLLPYIKTPTIIIWGKGDTTTPLKHGQLIHKLMPQSKIFVLENARHGIHLQAPLELKKIILDNLD